jgi:hypothetical protein
MEPVVDAVKQGDMAALTSLWQPALRPLANSFGHEDTCHPLLHAAHRLHVDAVKFLLDQGVSPRIYGTVHPYTGDCMTVMDLQGAYPGRGRGREAGRRDPTVLARTAVGARPPHRCGPVRPARRPCAARRRCTC